MTRTLDRAVTAAVRAGHAWSVRRDRPEAWAEVARMTGVIMRACGPGRGPVTPVELVAQLRRPIGAWLPGCDDAVAGLVILDEDDELTDATFELGCDYTAEVLAGQEDPGAAWLPGWRVHRAEQIERSAFHALLAGSDEDYSRGRRFITENPAGVFTELLAARQELGLAALVSYADIPGERQCDGVWWPCPVCRWPMRVRGTRVRCDFPRHDAAYTLTGSRLVGPRAPKGRPVDRAVCVDESVWRYIVVPGVVEVRLHDRIDALPGVEASLYPQKDLYDIQAGEFTLDVKDYASARALARRLEERPIAAGHLVLPNYRRDQAAELRRLLPGLSVVTEEQIYRRIRRAASRRNDDRT